MENINRSRPMQPSTPEQEAPKSGWLQKAINAVREVVSGPHIPNQSRPQGIDRFSSTGCSDINAPRRLKKFCDTGQGNGSKHLAAISNEFYIQLCNEIANHQDSPASAPRPNTRRA